jgi:membrane associated rhomboid family serine protease
MIPTGGIFSNIARSLRILRSCYACWSVVAIILSVHLTMSLGGGLYRPSIWRIYKLFGLTRNDILDGKIWKLFTYGFLHGSWWHVLLNALFVLLVGSRVESTAGRGVMLKTLVLGILGGGLAHLFLSPTGRGAPLLVGLSGGCVALLLMLTTLSPKLRMMPLPISGRSLGFGILSSELLFGLINPGAGVPLFSELGRMLISYGFGSWFVMGHACHFGGGLAGWAYGRWFLRNPLTQKRLHTERIRREAEKAGTS